MRKNGKGEVLSRFFIRRRTGLRRGFRGSEALSMKTIFAFASLVLFAACAPCDYNMTDKSWVNNKSVADITVTVCRKVKTDVRKEITVKAGASQEINWSVDHRHTDSDIGGICHDDGRIGEETAPIEILPTTASQAVYKFCVSNRELGASLVVVAKTDACPADHSEILGTCP